MKSHLWRKPTASRCCAFLGGSGARVATGIGRVAFLPVCVKKHGKIEPKGPSDNSPPTRPCDRASAKPALGAVLAAHAEFVAALAGHPPRTMPLDADAIDLEDRADHLGKVFGALSVYVTLILDDTAQNIPGRLDLRDAEAVLADLASDVTGTIQKTADDMVGRPA